MDETIAAKTAENAVKTVFDVTTTGPGILGYIAIGYTVHYMSVLAVKLLKKSVV